MTPLLTLHLPMDVADLLEVLDAVEARHGGAWAQVGEHGIEIVAGEGGDDDDGEADENDDLLELAAGDD